MRVVVAVVNTVRRNQSSHTIQLPPLEGPSGPFFVGTYFWFARNSQACKVFSVFKKIVVIITLFLSTFGLLFHTPTHAAGTVSDEWKRVIDRRIPSQALRNIHGFSNARWAEERANFVTAIETVSNRFSIDPDLTLAFMLFESANTLDSSIYGSCIGLIQFCPGSGLIDTARVDSRCGLNSIRRLLPSEQTNICVNIYFQRNLRVKDRDLGTLYAMVNWPAGQYARQDAAWYCENRPTVVNGVTYSAAVFSRQSQSLQNNAEVINGVRCTTKRSAAKVIAEYVRTATGIIVPVDGVPAQDPNSSLPSGSLSEEELRQAILDLTNDESWKIKTLTQEQYDAALKELETRQTTLLQTTLRNDFALPLNIFQECRITDASGAPVLISGGDILTGCIRGILTYIFIIAIIYTIIVLVTSNLSIVLTAGEGGAGPVANARKRIEKALIGLFFIGAPFLVLDLFNSGLRSFDFVPLDQIPKVQIASISIDSGLPDDLSAQPSSNNLLFNLFAVFGDRDATGVSTRAFEYANAIRDPDGKTDAFIPRKCTTDPNACKIIRDENGNTVQYISQRFNSKGEKTPFGDNACGAAASVMATAFLKPELYDISTGRNNIKNLGLRDQVFYASSYLASKSPGLTCIYAGQNSKDRSTKIDGAFAITGLAAAGWPSDICGLNNGAAINTYVSYYNVRVEATVGMNWNNPDPTYTRLRQALDENKPIVIRFQKTGSTRGHFATIIGYDKTSPSTFIVHDPWGNINIRGFPGTKDGGNGQLFDLNLIRNEPNTTFRILAE